MPWTCRLIHATETASLTLRRYAQGKLCAMRPFGMATHDARAFIGTAAIIEDKAGRAWDTEASMPPPDDPRWPSQCVCGYQFAEEDMRVLSKDRYYKTEGGRRLTLGETEPGMIWDAPWYTDFADPWQGADGRCLVCKLPDGTEWVIDGPATSGGRWTRTGVPPALTVTPSIKSPGYHGFLTAGLLTDDTEGRTYA